MYNMNQYVEAFASRFLDGKAFESVLVSGFIALTLLAGSFIALRRIYRRLRDTQLQNHDSEQLITTGELGKPHGRDLTQESIEDHGYNDITPLPELEWQQTEPKKYRPYKPKYNLTMSIEQASISEILEIDNKYLDRIVLRRRIMDEHSDAVLGAYFAAKPAVDELYIWLTSTYLPVRFPKMFQLRTDTQGRSILWNSATAELVSLTPAATAEETLRRLGGLVEDDLLFLLPADDGDGYQLKAFVTCFPNGFNTKNKLGMKLREIHTPVPGYKEKLERSMDRWFSKLKVGTYVKRYNWTITPHGNLFTATGNHLYEGEVAEERDVEIENTYVRSERQMVHRLPKSKAILFSFKTYLYPISEIKEEGLGDVLADAIEGLRTGNVPSMHFYKKAAVWGASVQKYLRS